MYIHVGEGKIVSDRNLVGIFNAQILRESELNREIVDSIEENVKTVVVRRDGSLITSKVSPFTVISRNNR